MLTALWGSIERGSRQSGFLTYGISVSSTLMRTVIETPTFQKQAERLWSEAERLAFILITLYAKNEQATIPPGEIPHGY